ncbi:MAG: hypothetical protein AAF449_03895 [Myxococcota bacterium]
MSETELEPSQTPTSYDINHPSDFHWVTGLMAGISAIAGIIGVGLLVSRDPEPRLDPDRAPLAIDREPFSGELLVAGGFGLAVICGLVSWASWADVSKVEFEIAKPGYATFRKTVEFPGRPTELDIELVPLPKAQPTRNRRR